MNFAGEIRNQIYRECLLVDRWTLATKPSSWGLSPNILGLSREIYKEAFPILWSENHWVTVKGCEPIIDKLETTLLDCRKAPRKPSPFKLSVYPVLTLKIDWNFQQNHLRDHSMPRPARLVNIFELPFLCRAMLDLPSSTLIKTYALIDTQKPKAIPLLKQLVNWSLFNIARYDRRLGYQVIPPITRISFFGRIDEIIHPDQGERLDLAWHHGENIRANARIWQQRLREAKGDIWLQRCIHMDQYGLFGKVTSLPRFIFEYGPKERRGWQRHVLSLGHHVARASIKLKDYEHAASFLATIWRWNALKLDGNVHLKNDMAETHYLMCESLRMQGQHIASLVHLVQALMLFHEHKEATAAAEKLLRDQSAVQPDEHEKFLYNLWNILNPVLWGRPIERSLLLKKGDETLPFMNFQFPEDWEVHWDWASGMRVREPRLSSKPEPEPLTVSVLTRSDPFRPHADQVSSTPAQLIIWASNVVFCPSHLATPGRQLIFGRESSFLEHIDSIRKREIRAIQFLLAIRNAINAVSMSLPIFASMLSFITFGLSKHPLTAAPIFSSLALFNSLKLLLDLLPMVIGQVTDA